MNRVGPVRSVTHLLWNAKWHMLLASLRPLMILILRWSGKKFVVAVLVMAGMNAAVAATNLSLAMPDGPAAAPSLDRIAG